MRTSSDNRGHFSSGSSAEGSERGHVLREMKCCAGRLEYSWEFCLIDFSVMADYLPDFKSVDETCDFDGRPYLFEPEYTD